MIGAKPMDGPSSSTKVGQSSAPGPFHRKPGTPQSMRCTPHLWERACSR